MKRAAAGLAAVLFLLLGLPLSLLLVTAAPATAAGTGGIEVTPVPAVSHGRQVTAFHVHLPRRGTSDVAMTLRNVTKSPRTGRVYVASATPDGNTYDIGGAGSTPYVRFPDATVTLAAGEVRKTHFSIGLRGRHRPGRTVYAAVVVEVGGGSLVQRAATLIYLEPQKPLDLPLIGVIGVGLVVLMGAAVITARSHERVPPGFFDEEP